MGKKHRAPGPIVRGGDARRDAGADARGDNAADAVVLRTWKTSDFNDSLHVLDRGVAAAMSTKTQLKVELLDTYKNRPPLVTIQKNDVAILVTVVHKM